MSHCDLDPATAEGAPDPFAGELRKAAAETRHGIGQLRSLLVEIYPPELHRAGLEATLADLLGAAARARRRARRSARRRPARSRCT